MSLGRGSDLALNEFDHIDITTGASQFEREYFTVTLKNTDSCFGVNGCSGHNILCDTSAFDDGTHE